MGAYPLSSKTRVQATLPSHHTSEVSGKGEDLLPAIQRQLQIQPKTHIVPLPQNTISKKSALNLNLYLAAFYNYRTTWPRGHGPTWTRKAGSERGGELATQFSHTFLEKQFSSPK